MTEPRDGGDGAAEDRRADAAIPSASARDCSRRRCGAAVRRRRTRAPRFRRTAQSRAWSSRNSPARRRTACTPSPAAPIPATTPWCCASSRRTTPPTFTTIRGVSTGCQGDKIVGPSCGMTILVIADECVTEPNVTLTYTATGEADAAALHVAERPTTIRSDGSSSSAAASCGTRWTYTYSPGWAPHLPVREPHHQGGRCFDRAPFGAARRRQRRVAERVSDGDELIGADTRHVVIDNTPPAPVTVTLTREDDGKRLSGWWRRRRRGCVDHRRL